MLSQTLLAALSLLPLSQAETVLGVYVFHRHGDRTAKAWTPVNLTDLGYSEVYSSGSYYRSRYIEDDATSQILGVSADIVTNTQITALAPSDVVLQSSALGFLQGLYPAVGDALGSQTLRNGTNVTAPLSGYQLIPVGLVTSGSGGEDSTWLEATTGCGAATVSSNEYYSSTQYLDLLDSTADFYQSILPVINTTFNSSTDTYKNAYTIFDYINVAEIHNATIQSADLITNETFLQISTLANTHEWNLAFNESSLVRAIAGMTLAAEINQQLNTTIVGKAKSKIGVQFGNYATMMSLFGLTSLELVNPDFYGIANYASSLVFELVTNSTSINSSHPIPSDLSEVAVRFSFANGSASDTNVPVAYPLFNYTSTEMPWETFYNNMNSISVGTTEAWCKICQNSTGTCAAYYNSSDDSSSSSSSSNSSSSTTSDEKSGNGLSPAVNGVIGAMVALAVVLGIEALILLAGGLTVVSKKRVAHGTPSEVQNAKS